MKRILVVDDDQSLRMIICKALHSEGYAVDQAQDGEAALEKLKESSFDLLITDLSMPKLSGIELIVRVRETRPDMGCIMVTAYGTIHKAVEAMQKGAFDFITKPFTLEQIESKISRFFEIQNLQKENSELKKQLSRERKKSTLVGNSKGMTEVKNLISFVAASDATVLISGESGTGKELVAQEIHQQSARAAAPFLKINCAALPETLFESILFGHEKGAFSGAHKSQKGMFEECDGGTILLDEISEIPVNLQAKLLRVLQEMRIYRIGNTREIPIDVRVIATSNRDLPEQVRSGNFREDLFFRLNVFPIHVPALNERTNDIPPLVHHFAELYSGKYGNNDVNIADDAMRKLCEYHWPGNVRQLQHIVERAYLLAKGRDSIVAADIWLQPEGNDSPEELQKVPDLCSLEEMERKMIFRALQETKYQKIKAAKLLGISDRTLRNKLKQYEMEEELVEG